MSIISVSEHLAALVNVEVQARDKERESIIKLIKDYQHPRTQHEFNDEFCDGIIALIKGENK